MKRLSILPEFWHKGFGREMVDYIIDYLKDSGIAKLYIAIVNEQSVLKDWYKKMGFQEISVESFDGLPFRVCFLELEL